MFLPAALAFLVGLGNGWLMSSDELADMKAKVDRMTEHRAMGGKATKRLSTEQETLATKYIETEMKPSVSRWAACNRAAP